MKEFHIVNVGNSLLTNCFNENLVKKERFDNNEFWQSRLEDKKFVDLIYEKVKLEPQKYTAELNSFLNFNKDKDYTKITVYLSGTNTPSNAICIKIISGYLKNELGCCVLNPKEFSGYFAELENYDVEYARNEFIRDISNMLDRFIYLAKKKKQEGYEVFLNPTGGFKAHVIACALAAVLTNTTIYYMHEEFKNIVEFPHLFYLPKGNEVDILSKLSNEKPVSSRQEFKELSAVYPDEIERLNIYGLVELEKDEDGLPIKIRITNKGKHFLELKIK